MKSKTDLIYLTFFVIFLLTKGKIEVYSLLQLILNKDLIHCRKGRKTMIHSEKQRAAAIALLMAGIVLLSAIITAFTGVTKREDNRFRIIATFYPVYVAALNVADGVENTQVVNLTSSQTGCLHDYQLSPDNLITLTGADVLVLNGAGAESFLDHARKQFPNLPVVDTSYGVSLLENSGADDADFHDVEELYNEHIWVSPSRYIQQVENLRDGLSKIDPKHAEEYHSNAEVYISKIKAVREKLLDAVAALPTKECITFHNSLSYLADDLGLHPVAALAMGEESGVSAADIAAAGNAAKAAGKILLLYDSQYPTEYTYVADGASFSRILTLDSAVSGIHHHQDKTSWLDAMQSNADVLLSVGQG